MDFQISAFSKRFSQSKRFFSNQKVLFRIKRFFQSNWLISTKTLSVFLRFQKKVLPIKGFSFYQNGLISKENKNLISERVVVSQDGELKGTPHDKFSELGYGQMEAAIWSQRYAQSLDGPSVSGRGGRPASIARLLELGKPRTAPSSQLPFP